MKYKIPDEEFIQIVKTSFTIAEALRKMNLSPFGSSYKMFKKRCLETNIDCSHFIGRGHNKGKKLDSKVKTKLEDYLIENCPKILHSKVKYRLIKEGYLTEICYICKLGPTWNEKTLVLQLDHINGNSFDNRIENIRLLCPNCHSQTPTFCSKNKQTANSKNGIKYKNLKNNPKIYYCERCKNEKLKQSKYCRECYDNYRSELQTIKTKTKIVWPQKEQLLQMLKESNYTQVAKLLGVSDNAIRKHLKLT